jgi:hypothetical protein
VLVRSEPEKILYQNLRIFKISRQKARRNYDWLVSEVKVTNEAICNDGSGVRCVGWTMKGKKEPMHPDNGKEDKVPGD